MKVYQILFSYKRAGKEVQLIEAENLEDAIVIAYGLFPNHICPTVDIVKREVFETGLNPKKPNHLLELNILRKKEKEEKD